MPYGSYIKPGPPTLVEVFDGAVSRSVYSRSYGLPAGGTVAFTRGGTNTVTVRGKASKPSNGKPVLKSVKDPAIRVVHKRYNKRTKEYYYVRAPLMVPRVVYKKPKSAKKKKKSPKSFKNMPPNALSFLQRKFSFFPEGPQTLTSRQISNPARVVRHVGDLWADFAPYGSVNVNLYPNPQNLGGGISSRFAAFVTQADNLALPAFYNKLKGQDVNLAQAFAERNQTIKLISDLAKRLAVAFLAVKRLNFNKAFQALHPTSLKQLGNDWLAFQYGVRPLLSDIDGAMKALATPSSMIFTVVVKKKVLVPASSTTTSQSASTLFSTSVETSSGYVEVMYKVKVRVKSIARTYSQTGFSSLPALAWELAPYSFVFDWFLPIGKYLNNQDAFYGLEIVSATRTVFQKEKYSMIRNFSSTSTYQVDPLVTGVSKEVVSVTRSLLTQFPPLPFPSFKNPISAEHVGNALALLSKLKKG